MDLHAELPLDPDAELDESQRDAPRPLHLRPALVAWVALGGVAGAAARIGVGAVLPRVDGLPLPTLAVNLVGALVLGALLEALARRGPDAGVRRLARLGAGTGLCGAFTTYSSFAVETDLLVRDGRAVVALVYLLVSVLLGLAATATGIWVAGAQHRSARVGDPA